MAPSTSPSTSCGRAERGRRPGAYRPLLALVLGTLILAGAAGRTARAAPSLQVRGSVRCLERGRADLAQPIGGIVVYPRHHRDLATLTSSEGTFVVSVAARELVGRSEELVFVTPARMLWQEPLFVSESEIETWGRDRVFRVNTVVLRGTCAQLDSSLDPRAVGETLTRLREKPTTSRASSGTVAAPTSSGIVSLLASLASLLAPLGAAGPPPTVPETLAVRSYDAGPYALGNQTLRHLASQASEIGFAIAPCGAPPGALANASLLAVTSTNSVTVSAGTGRELGADLVWASGASTGIAGSGRNSRYSSEHTILIEDGSTRRESWNEAENTFALGVGRRLTPWLAVGLAGRVVSQSLRRPARLLRTDSLDAGHLEYESLARRGGQLDLSGVLVPARGVRLGVAGLGLAGPRALDSKGGVVSERLFAIGGSLQRGRARIGAECHWPRAAGAQAAAGVGLRLWRTIECTAGVASFERARQVTLGWSWGRLRYGHDSVRGDTYGLDSIGRF